MLNELVTSDPEIMGGTPCIKGTRLTVYSVASRIRGGETPAELLDGYPATITEKHVQAALEYAERVPFVEATNGRPWRSNKSAKVSRLAHDTAFEIGLARMSGVWVKQQGQVVAAFSDVASACRWLESQLGRSEASADPGKTAASPEQTAA